MKRFTLVMFWHGMVALLICHTASSTGVDDLVSSLETCSSEVQTDIQCLERPRDGLQQVSDYIEQVRNLKNTMKKINDGFNTLNTVMNVVKFIPGIGTAISTVKTGISVAKRTFTAAYGRVRSVDSRLYSLKARCDAGATRLDQAIIWLERVEGVCDRGGEAVEAAQDCVDDLPEGSFSTSLENNLDSLAGAVNEPVSEITGALGAIGDTCREIDSFASALPSIGFIINGIDDFYDVLEPILDFFKHVQDALDEEFCVGDALDAVGEIFDFDNWFKRRKRSVAEQMKLHSLLKRSIQVRNKRSFWCVSLQDAVDVIDDLVGPIFDLVNDFIGDLLDGLPSIDLPGLPDFGNIFDIDLDFNVDLPDIDIDVQLFTVFSRLTWDCAINVQSVCELRFGNVTVSCNRAISSYNGK